MSALADEIRAAVREALRDELPRVLGELRAVGTPRTVRIGVAEASNLARRHPDTVRRAIKAGRLRASRPSGAREWILDAADVERWVQGEAVTTVDMKADVEAALARALDSRAR